MNHILKLALLCIIPLTLTVVRSKAEGPIPSMVPADSGAVFVITHPTQADAQLSDFARAVNLPLFGSSWMMAKSFLGLTAGIDDTKPFAMAWIPSDVGETGEEFALFVATSDEAALLEALGAEPVEGDVYQGRLSDEDAYMKAMHGYMILAPKQEVLRSIESATVQLNSKLTPEQLSVFEEEDLCLWVSLASLAKYGDLSQQTPWVQELTAAFGMSAEQTTLVAAADFSSEGLGLRFQIHNASKTAIAPKNDVNAGADRPLLAGLPADNFVMAYGQGGGQESFQAMAESLDSVFAAIPEDQRQRHVSDADFQAIRQLYRTTIHDVRWVGVSMNRASDDAARYRLTKIVDTAASAPELIGRISEFATLGNRIFAAAMAGTKTAKRSTVALALCEWDPNAETVGKVSVHQLRLNFGIAEELEPAGRVAESMFGDSTVTVRLAAPDERTLVAQSGGTLSDLEATIERVRAGRAPLSEMARIQSVSAELPETRQSVLYVDLGAVVEWLGHVWPVVTSGAMPVESDGIHDPIAISTSPAGPGGTRTDVFISKDLLAALTRWGESMRPAQTAPVN